MRAGFRHRQQAAAHCAGRAEARRREGARLSRRGQLEVAQLSIQVQQAARQAPGVGTPAAGAATPLQGGSAAAFGAALAQVERRQLAQDLTDARTAAEQLREHFTMANFQRFKQAVYTFLRHLATERYGTEHHYSDGRRYSVIAEIQSELAQLESDFTGDYREEMLWLRRVAAIEGMILDLYV